MSPETKTRIATDSFIEALHSEILAGTENLSGWIKYIQSKNGIETLFELETWLRGLRAFFDVRHLPLGDTDKNNLVSRSFAPEIRIVRQTLQECWRCASEVAELGQPEILEFEAFIESQMGRDNILDYHVGKILEQPTPMDSLAALMDGLDDLRVMIDALDDSEAQDYQLFLSVGRTYGRTIKSCRYIEMLLSQRFKLQYDKVDNPVPSTILRGITEPQTRRDVALALLHLYRFLKYLGLVSRELSQDRPLRHCVTIFSLLHEEMDHLCAFLRTRFLKARDAGHGLLNASELIVYSIRMESHRAFDRELLLLSRAVEAPPIYTTIENCHGLLRNCFQSNIITLLQAFDRKFDGRTLFPSMVHSLENTQKLRKDLWDLRQYLKSVLERREELDLNGVLEKLTTFRETSLRLLMYRDWGEFEQLSDTLVAASDGLEARTHLRKFISFLETLLQEISKRSVLQEKARS